MPIEDDIPNRRNLNVMSLAFLTYYLAGGEIDFEGGLRLLVATVTFERHWVLTAIAWLLWFWFLLRYWQVTKDSYLGAIRNHSKGRVHLILQRDKVLEDLNQEYPGQKITDYQLDPNKVALKDGVWTIHFHYRVDGKVQNKRLEFKYFSRKGLFLLLGFIILNKDFGNLQAPYILFTISFIVSIAGLLSGLTPSLIELLGRG